MIRIFEWGLVANFTWLLVTKRSGNHEFFHAISLKRTHMILKWYHSSFFFLYHVNCVHIIYCRTHTSTMGFSLQNCDVDTAKQTILKFFGIYDNGTEINSLVIACSDYILVRVFTPLLPFLDTQLWTRIYLRDASFTKTRIFNFIKMVKTIFLVTPFK